MARRQQPSGSFQSQLAWFGFVMAYWWTALSAFLIREQARAVGWVDYSKGRGHRRTTQDNSNEDRSYYSRQINSSVLRAPQATIVATDDDKIVAKMETGKTVEFSSREYQSISHGYAMTVHKSQHYELDRTRVLVTNTFDRNVSKIAMSQHKKELTLYYGKNGFKNESPVEVWPESDLRVEAHRRTK